MRTIATSHPRVAPARSAATALVAAAFMLDACGLASAQDGEARRNYFDDPFVQATDGLPGCPVPEGPLITLQEMRAQAHGRVDRGTTCFRSGRCRLPNAYQYDRELVPRVRLRIASDERYAGSSVWLTGQRRWIYLQGCVATQADADAMERAVREVDDVEAVIPELMIGTSGVPRYRVAGQDAAAAPAASAGRP